MRIARFDHHGTVSYGALDGDTLDVLDSPWPGPDSRPTGRRIPLDQVRLLAPVQPRLVVGMARNTGPDDHARPAMAFLKPPGTVIAPRAPIPLPPGVGQVVAEAELAVVIGTTARHLTAATALKAVFGYTVANDVTALDLLRSDPLWAQAKGYDGFTPVGPWIDTDLDPEDVGVRLTNGPGR